MRRLRWLLAVCLATAGTARAGPPFLTDDPVPTDYRRWEIYGYGEAAVLRHGCDGEAGVDVNYGGFRDVQLTATLPYGGRQDGASRLTLGDIEAGIKYRFVHATGIVPDIAFFPKLSVPTGGRLGSGRVGAQLPAWAQWNRGEWALFGGGGYAINPGAGRRDFWFAGATVTRRITPGLTLGAEVFRQGRDVTDGQPTTAAGLGATVAVSRRWSVLGGANAGIGGDANAAGHRVYVALLFHD